MGSHADKTRGSGATKGTRGLAGHGGERSALTYTDSRPEAIVQTRLREMANGSPGAERTARLQAVADQSRAVVQRKFAVWGTSYESNKISAAHKALQEQQEWLGHSAFAEMKDREAKGVLKERIKAAEEYSFDHDAGIPAFVMKAGEETAHFEWKDVGMKAFFDALLGIKEAEPEAVEEALPEKDIVYQNGVKSGDVEARLSANILQQLRQGIYQARHMSDLPTINSPGHQHIAGGSGGISFYYRSDGTPVIYDYASKRTDSKYRWQVSGETTGAESGAAK